MSLILDALKKLDREKISKRVGQTDIADEILKPGDSVQYSSVAPLVFALAITASLAAAVTYLIFGGSVPRTVDSRSTVPAASVQTRQAAVAPLPVAPSIAVSKAVSTVKTKKSAEPAAKVEASAGAEAPRKAAVAPEAESGPLPTLKISGIVWQEMPSERKAVINGRVAREGDSVEGIKVLEIYPTFVNVSFKGKSFKLKMFD